MKTIHKIAAILYSVWAFYRSYILIQAVIYSQFNIFYILLLLVPSLSLITSSIFIVINSFVKKYSLKREICSIVWLCVNMKCLIIIAPMTYLVTESIILYDLLYFDFCTDKVISIISFILSKPVLIVFALFNIIINSLKICGVDREKV